MAVSEIGDDRCGIGFPGRPWPVNEPWSPVGDGYSVYGGHCSAGPTFHYDFDGLVELHSCNMNCGGVGLPFHYAIEGTTIVSLSRQQENAKHGLVAQSVRAAGS